MTEKKPSRFIKFAYYAATILLVTYILSIGPAFAVATNSRYGSDVPYVSAYSAYEIFDSFYAPLLWVGKNIQFIDDTLFDYKVYCFKKMYPNTYSSLGLPE